MTSTVAISQDTIPYHLEKEYRRYLSAQDRGDVSAVEACLSPACWQISRQDPAWNLKDRADIMRILISLGLGAGSKEGDRGSVKIRELTQEERGTIPEMDKEKAALEGWEGLHVVIEDADVNGFLVKVNYYWRKEEGAWVQCLHDLLWLGRRDGSEAHDVGAAVFGKQSD